MQRIDALIVGALLVAAVGSAIGVATYEDDRLASFRVTWATIEEALDVPVTGAGTAFEGALDVSFPNVTRAVWTATVTGSAARVQPVDILVEVIAPDNATTTAEAQLAAGPGASTSVPVEVVLATTPNATSVTAASPDAALAALSTGLGSTNGTGTWTVRVTLAPTAPGPLGGVETFTVAVDALFETYEAAVAPETPEVGGR